MYYTALHCTILQCIVLYCNVLYYTAMHYQLEELLPLLVVLEGEERDSAPHGFILTVLLHLPLGLLLLVQDEVLLVKALQVVDHPPVCSACCSPPSPVR